MKKRRRGDGVGEVEQRSKFEEMVGLYDKHELEKDRLLFRLAYEKKQQQTKREKTACDRRRKKDLPHK
jgi:hypothetical protein